VNKKNKASLLPNAYSKLISPVRSRPSRIKGRTLAEEVFSDRGRVLFSSPFRRLQNKAQVFSLERDASVRSRLTHSLEVSSIGRFIAQRVALQLNGAKRGKHFELDDSFVTFVEVACLLHDIGNPPFGHFGEKAISKWFLDLHREVERREFAARIKGTASGAEFDGCYAELTRFDGNPQGLRLVTRLQPRFGSDRAGLNLTLTAMAATIKYPWTAAQSLQENRTKFGFFSTEADLYDQIRDELGIKPGSRHPIVYLVEAADDTAYSLSDIEDGLVKGLLKLEDLRLHLENECRGDQKIAKLVQSITPPFSFVLLEDDHDPAVIPSPEPYLSPIQEFRGGAIRLLTEGAADCYVENHAKVLKGEFFDLIRNDTSEGRLLRALKSFAVKKLYCSQIVRSREITAFKVLQGILNAHKDLLLCDRERFERALSGDNKDSDGAAITVEASLLSRVPEKLVVAYQAAQKFRLKQEAKRQGTASPRIPEWKEWIDRAHLLIDYVSGMTDEHALEAFQLISGMSTDPRL
jgi:dGTPase